MTKVTVENIMENRVVTVNLPTTTETWNMMCENLGFNNPDNFDVTDTEITYFETDIAGLEDFEPTDIEDLDEFIKEYYKSDDETKDCVSALLEGGYYYYGDLTEVFDYVSNCDYFPDCRNMEEVAEFIAEKYNMLDKVPYWVNNAFDYGEFGSMLEENSYATFFEEKHGMVRIADF